MVLMKTEYVNRSGAAGGPYVTVVMRSWRTAHERLAANLAGAGGKREKGGTHKAAYIPPTQMRSWLKPGCDRASVATCSLCCDISAAAPFAAPLVRLLRSSKSEGSLRRGAACFWRAMMVCRAARRSRRPVIQPQRSQCHSMGELMAFLQLKHCICPFPEISNQVGQSVARNWA